nr:TrkA family potassium uptake protein [Mediterraneibacter faecis]
MKSILLIGLGRFGRHIAIKLDELHHQVMAVDKEDTRVDAVLPFVTNAQIGDATSEDFLSSLGVGNFDVCIVAIGDDFQNSLEVTSLLKELGARMVVSRASRDVHAKFLLRNGADEIVYPERQLADWVAIRYSADHISMVEDVKGRGGSGYPSMQRAKCCLSFFPHWHRMRAGPFQRIAHGESTEGLKQENIK